MLLIQIGIQKIDALRPILLGIIVCIVLCAGLSDIGKRWFCNAIISKYEEHSQEYFENTEFSYLHWMNMGLNEESMGGYSLEDVEATKAIVGKKNKSAALKESIKDRLSAFGFGGYLKFLNGKVIYMLCKMAPLVKVLFGRELALIMHKQQKNCRNIFCQHHLIGNMEQLFLFR